MLIEFRVTNFRSFKETQILSMVANTDSSLQESNCIASGINAASASNLIRSAALYGPNASGKSNLILALALMRSIIETSATSIQEEQTIDDVKPFRFNSESMKNPSEFEVIFVQDGIRYQYGFSMILEQLEVHHKKI